MSYLYVGATKDYTTIQSAIDAASDGDLIFVDPAQYLESIVINKAVSLRANTETFTNTVEIRGGTTAVNVSYTPSSPRSIYIEGFKISHTGGSWTRCFDITSANADLSLYLNKCYISVGTDRYPIEPSDQFMDTFEIKNCYLQRGYAHIVNANWDRINYGALVKVHLNNAYFCYSCVGAADVNDNVTTTTSGYGPWEGEFYNGLSIGYFDGYVFQEGVPVERTVRLHRRDTGYLLHETTSSGDGSYYIETTYSGSHYIVTLDDEAGESYNDIIVGNVYPTTFSG